MTDLPRAATIGELTKLRRENQSSRLYLTIHRPATIYTATLGTVPASTDSVISIPYVSGSGTHTDILAGMTLWVGSTPGAFDLGQCRIRSTTGIGPTSGTFVINETSEIAWTAGANLTVVNEFLLWRRDPRVLSSGTVYMDYDIAYTDQHSHCQSVVVMGPPAVKWLRGASVTVFFDASNSWCVNNTITGYVWAAPGAASTSAMTTATPIITYNTPGTYRVSCTVTNSDGVSATGYRYVFILGEGSTAPAVISHFNLDNLAGDYASGGWSAQVSLLDQADLSLVRDRAMAILHRRDWYGVSSVDEQSIGYVNDRENLEMVGYIALEADQIAPADKFSLTTFTIQGPQWWLNKITAFPVGMKDRNSAPTKWTRFWGLTARASSWHLLNWHTTATTMMDVYPMDSSIRMARAEAAGAQTLWTQLNTILDNYLIARPCCDSYGRLFMQREQNCLSSTARATIPTVLTLTRSDWTNVISFDRRQVDDVGYVDLSGVSWDGHTPTPIFALAPGHVFRQYGAAEVRDRLVLDTQAEANTLAGAYYGWKNNPYPRFTFDLAANHRLIDLAPYQYVAIDIAAGDTPRGFTATGLRLIPRVMRRLWNKAGNYFLTQLEVEAETPIGLSVTGDTPPTPPEVNVDPPPIIIPPPPPVPQVNADAKIMWMLHTNAASNPPIAAIYEILDDYNAPVYTALIPPGSLYIDQLIFGNYVSGVLMLVAHATATPTGPGWAGGPGHILVHVSNPTTSPTWTLIGVFEQGITTGVIGDGTVPDAGLIGGTPYANFTRTATGFQAIGFHAAYFINKYLIFVTLTSRITGGWVNPATGIEGPLPIGSNSGGSIGYSQSYSPVYWQPVANGGGPMPAYPSTIDAGGLYTYGVFAIRGGTDGLSLYTVRRLSAGGNMQIVKTSLFGSGGGTMAWTVQNVCDETGVTYPLFANTLNKSTYLNLVLPPANVLYYTTDGGTWIKAAGSVPYGFAHYLKASGGNSLLWIGAGAVTNGSEPARYTANITDLTANPWVQMTGNMWSGGSKIFTSGDLFIQDSFLGF